MRTAEALDRESIPVGPFARLDANAVAARDGKTRGSITNLFGSQSAFQAETMAQVMSARDWIDRIAYPTPTDHDSGEAWIDALLLAESGRGPQPRQRTHLELRVLVGHLAERRAVRTVE